jgi:hypothetical protein
MEGRMSGYDTDDILSQALDLAENEDENIFITVIFPEIRKQGYVFYYFMLYYPQALGAKTPLFV